MLLVLLCFVFVFVRVFFVLLLLISTHKALRHWGGVLTSCVINTKNKNNTKQLKQRKTTSKGNNNTKTK